MKTHFIQSLTSTFEAHAQQTESGVEYWLARDIQYLLGYAKWENFLNAVSRAKTACEVSNHPVADHFPDIRKMVDLGSGSQREIVATPMRLIPSRTSLLDTHTNHG
jgi:DNA-damage-inducible protein D